MYIMQKWLRYVCIFEKFIVYLGGYNIKLKCSFFVYIMGYFIDYIGIIQVGGKDFVYMWEFGKIL